MWEELQALAPKEKEKVEAYISLLQESGEDLRRPNRVLYFFFLRDNAVLLHLFRKKTDRLPDAEKGVALSRMADFIRRVELGEIRLEEGE